MNVPYNGKHGTPWIVGDSDSYEVLTTDGTLVSRFFVRTDPLRVVACVNGFDGLTPSDWTKILKCDPVWLGRLLEATNQYAAMGGEPCHHGAEGRLLRIARESSE